MTPKIKTMTSYCKGELLEDIKRNLIYWQTTLQALDDERVRALSSRHASLLWAVQLGVRCSDSRILAGQVVESAFLWIERERHERLWLPVLEELINSAEIKSDTDLNYQLMVNYGVYLRLNGQYSSSIFILSSALKELHQFTVPAKKAALHFQLCESYRRTVDLQQALHHGHQALTLSETVSDAILEAGSLNSIGLLNLSKGKHELAFQFFNKALAAESTIGQPTRLARVLNNLALTRSKQKNKEEALDYFTRCLEVLKPTTNKKDQVVAYINQGSLYFDLKDYDSAETAFYFAQALLVQLKGLIRYEAMVETNLGQVAKSREHYKDALERFKKAEKKWSEVGDPINLGNILGAIAEVYAATNEVDLAQRFFDSALNILSKYPDHDWATKMFEGFTKSRQKLG